MPDAGLCLKPRETPHSVFRVQNPELCLQRSAFLGQEMLKGCKGQPRATAECRTRRACSGAEPVRRPLHCRASASVDNDFFCVSVCGDRMSFKRLREAYVPCFIVAKTLRDPSRLGVNKGTVRPGRSQGCVHIAWMSNAPSSLLPALVTPTLLSALHTSLQWLRFHKWMVQEMLDPLASLSRTLPRFLFQCCSNREDFLITDVHLHTC